MNDRRATSRKKSDVIWETSLPIGCGHFSCCILYADGYLRRYLCKRGNGLVAALTRAGFRAGKTVLSPAIGGSIGNAVTQLTRASGAKHAMSSTTNHAKAEQAKASDPMKLSIHP
jgi:hypothetical protein